MRAVVLLSGGLDSVVAATLATRDMTLAVAITADYGQRAAGAEIRAARLVAAALGIPLETVHLPWVGRASVSALTSPDRSLPHPGVTELTGQAATRSAAAVWVPNRNGLLVNLAAVYAEAMDCGAIVAGFNAEEAATFPDNSPEFVDATNAALAMSTRSGVRVVSPTLGMTKAEIVRAGRAAHAPLRYVWSCYEAGPAPCGRCESCCRLQRALDEV